MSRHSRMFLSGIQRLKDTGSSIETFEDDEGKNG